MKLLSNWIPDFVCVCCDFNTGECGGHHSLTWEAGPRANAGQVADLKWMEIGAGDIFVLHSHISNNSHLCMLSTNVTRVCPVLTDWRPMCVCRYIFPADKVEVADITDKTSLLALIGPNSDEVSVCALLLFPVLQITCPLSSAEDVSTIQSGTMLELWYERHYFPPQIITVHIDT